MFKETIKKNLPPSWHESLIKDISDVVRGSSPRPAGSPLYFDGDFLPWTTVADLTKDEGMYLEKTRSMLTEEGAKLTRTIHPGTLLLTNSGATLGVPKISRIKSGANDGIAMLLNLKGVTTEYAYYFLSSKTQFFREVIAPGVGQPNLNTDLIGGITIPIPPILEQNQITKILSTWDHAITIINQLIAIAKNEQQAISGSLLSGKKRFPNFGNWKNKVIGDLINENRAQGTTGNIAKKLTVRLYGQGVIAKNEKRLGSESTKYYTRSAGQFIYSKLDFLNGAFGIIPEHLDGYESTLDLPAFDFKESVDTLWFLKYVSQESFYKSNIDLANGGRKARRVNPADFLKIKISVPPYEEQKKISWAISVANREIEVLQFKLNCLKQEKKALMQQLLTGKRRVKVEAA
ncbi:restriction endonuclease subunit S [Pseudomonas sp. P2757]|uniref:restriction endonuclease subunit S n=1 Tax=unclassified Pseudomonas TaxID=196821 RepID=UPI003B58DBE2